MILTSKQTWLIFTILVHTLLLPQIGVADSSSLTKNTAQCRQALSVSQQYIQLKIKSAIENIRNDQLKSLTISLDDVLNAVEEIDPKADSQNLMALSQFINPKWDSTLITSTLKKRSSFFRRNWRALSGSGELTKVAALVQLEYLLRYNLDGLRSLERSYLTMLIGNLWAFNSMQAQLQTNAASVAEKYEMANMYLAAQDLKFDGTARYPAPQIATVILNTERSVNLANLIAQTLREEPSNLVTKSIVEQTKIEPGELLVLARENNLSQTNPNLWNELITKTINTKPAVSKKGLDELHRWYEYTLQNNFQNGLNLARTLQPIWAKQLSKDQYFSNFQSLLARATSTPARDLVLREMVKGGNDILPLYLQDPKGIQQKLETLLNLSITEASLQQSIETSVTQLYHSKPELLSPRLKSLILKKYPKITEQGLKENVAMVLDVYDPNSNYKELIKKQDQINTSLIEQLKSVVNANAPPKAFAKSPRPWATYLASLPSTVRASQTLALLEKNNSSTTVLSNFISQLDPYPGVSETVHYFLKNSKFMNSNRSDFSQQQVLEMFGGDRIQTFFPHAKLTSLSGAIRTQFIIAVHTEPTQTGNGLNLAWLREKLEEEGVYESIPAVYGFRPAFEYGRLQTQINNNFETTYMAPPPEQTRGLIVQGYYEKQGFSLMSTMRDERGQDDVEDRAPQLMRDMEKSLRTGGLSKRPRLEQSLFVKNWNLTSNNTLIENMRSRAITIASARESFRSLRVEIHNFPTAKTLVEVKQYFANMESSSSVYSQVEQLIKELETFLYVGKSSEGLQTLLRDKIEVSDENRKLLTDISEGWDHLDAIGQLKLLLKLRKEVDAIKDKSESTLKEIERHRAHHLFADLGVSIFSEWINNYATQTPVQKYEAIETLLNHALLDGFIAETEMNSWLKSLKQMTNSRSIESIEQKKLISQLLNGIVDTVYYKMIDGFGVADNSIYTSFRTQQPVRFVDDVLRSSLIAMISKMADMYAQDVAISKNINHHLNGKNVHGAIQVHNAGDAIGILRLNKNPLELVSGEIGVFEEMPTELGPSSGIITVGSGARLSHVQLLAKSLGIPNVQLPRDLLENIQAFDGKTIRMRASVEGQLEIELVDSENHLVRQEKKYRVKIPQANHKLNRPISFGDYRQAEVGSYAGPKGEILAKLFQSKDFKEHTTDGVIIPFGFFNRYIEAVGLTPLVEALAQTKLANSILVGTLAAKIQMEIRSKPIPKEFLEEVFAELMALRNRRGNTDDGFFFRSDTNVEDLPEFNGAGLNDSVPNVQLTLENIDQAIRNVWTSPLSEKSIFWRGLALGRSTVTIAEPSVVVMPTVNAKSSGVLITKGTSDWKSGHGTLSANFGIGSVVQAGRPVEEYSFEIGIPYRFSLSSSRTAPTPNKDGGLSETSIQDEQFVLTLGQATNLNQMGQKVEAFLGSQPHGWDIEWGIDHDDKIKILQARPNM